MRTVRYPLLCFILLTALRCRDVNELEPSTPTVASDNDLYELITSERENGSYMLFPETDSVVAGTLNGSTAHRPLVRVSMNAVALGALGSGKLPPGGNFPDGSAIVKDIRQGGNTTVHAVMYRDRGNPYSGQGWLWAEYAPDGRVLVSLEGRGAGCISCHEREQGLANDLVRTFERQRP